MDFENNFREIYNSIFYHYREKIKEGLIAKFNDLIDSGIWDNIVKNYKQYSFFEKLDQQAGKQNQIQQCKLPQHIALRLESLYWKNDSEPFLEFSVVSRTYYPEKQVYSKGKRISYRELHDSFEDHKLYLLSKIAAMYDAYECHVYHSKPELHFYRFNLSIAIDYLRSYQITDNQGNNISPWIIEDKEYIVKNKLKNKNEQIVNLSCILELSDGFEKPVLAVFGNQYSSWAFDGQCLYKVKQCNPNFSNQIIHDQPSFYLNYLTANNYFHLKRLLNEDPSLELDPSLNIEIFYQPLQSLVGYLDLIAASHVALKIDMNFVDEHKHDTTHDHHAVFMENALLKTSIINKLEKFSQEHFAQYENDKLEFSSFAFDDFLALHQLFNDEKWELQVSSTVPWNLDNKPVFGNVALFDYDRGYLEVRPTIQYDEKTIELTQSQILEAMQKNGYVRVHDKNYVRLSAQFVDFFRGFKWENSQNKLLITSLGAHSFEELVQENNIVLQDNSREFKNHVSKIRSLGILFEQNENTKLKIKDLNGKLRDYQTTGLQWLGQMQKMEFGACLADDMGLGKTIQVIALLLDYYSRTKKSKASLVVMPKSLLHNWKSEIKQFAPKLKCKIFHGASRNLKFLKDEIIFEYPLSKCKIKNH